MENIHHKMLFAQAQSTVAQENAALRQELDRAQEAATSGAACAGHSPRVWGLEVHQQTAGGLPQAPRRAEAYGLAEQVLGRLSHVAPKPRACRRGPETVGFVSAFRTARRLARGRRRTCRCPTAGTGRSRRGGRRCRRGGRGGRRKTGWACIGFHSGRRLDVRGLEFDPQLVGAEGGDAGLQGDAGEPGVGRACWSRRRGRPRPAGRRRPPGSGPGWPGGGRSARRAWPAGPVRRRPAGSTAGS